MRKTHNNTPKWRSSELMNHKTHGADGDGWHCAGESRCFCFGSRAVYHYTGFLSGRIKVRVKSAMIRRVESGRDKVQLKS